jgi:hypothetical protein
MSAFITLSLPLRDQECLLAALADLGFPASHVEVHGEPVPLIGYQGDQRVQRANIVLRRQHVGSAANDIGFEWAPTGFRAHVSQWDQAHGYGPEWIRKLQTAYGRQDALKKERLAQARARQDADIEARRVATMEDRRREEDRERLVQAQRKLIHDKAKRLGYTVEESRQGDSIRLVLVKNR